MDSLQRLNCYDRIFPVGQSDDPAEEPETILVDQGGEEARWVIYEDKSPLDDSPSVSAQLLPETVSSTEIGEGKMVLILRCRENTTNVIFATGMFMSGDYAQVTTRLGEQKAKASKWEISSNYSAVALWSGAQAIPFIKSLLDEKKLVVRVESRNRTDAQFNLGGTREAAEKIAAACNWKLD
jgi:type VI secretion system protein VasI